MFDNLPNRLTLFRIALIPLLVLIMSANFIQIKHLTIFNNLAALIFIIASLTDLLDGYFARKNQQVTRLGSFLDPIADKFLVITSLIMLHAIGRINLYALIILVLRELYITSLRLLALEDRVTVRVNLWGKFKTATQMMAIPLLMIYHPIYHISMYLLGSILLYISLILSIISATQYSLKFIKHLKKGSTPHRSYEL